MKHNSLIMLFMLIQMLAYNLNDNYFFFVNIIELGYYSYLPIIKP